uniref:Uncharacterized protein n=1 Tax=Megaselia scalaris TaxID=36166 RepID=T1GMH4_MEGSC
MKIKAINALNLANSPKIPLKNTVLEGNQHHHGDDDFELWDQSQMYRSENNQYR